MNILLADDHRVLRTGLTLLLKTQPDCDVVGEASNGEEVLALLEKTATDIVLLDLSMPVMNGLECLEEIRRRQYPVKVLVLTMYSEDQYITEVMERGADGYLCKDTLDAELFKALRTVAKGQKYLGERGAQALLNQVAQGGQKRATLSTREKEVLRALVHGYSLSDTALQLHLSIKTVSTYQTRLMQKLECQSKAELVDYALKHHLM